MRPRAVIVSKVTLQQTTQVPWTENHHMIQTLLPNRGDQPLSIGVLPRTPGCGDDFPGVQRLDATAKLMTVDRITIAEQIAPGIAFRERFDDLLTGPFGGRMCGDAKGKHPSPLMLDHQEHEQDCNRMVGTVKKSNRDDLAHVILQEGLPGLRRWPLHGLPEARHGSFGNLDAELLQFAMNPGRSPQGIGLHQGSDQSANLRVDRGSAYGSDPLRKLRPVAAETFALPAHHRVWMNDEQGTPPVLPYRRQGDPEPAVAPHQLWTFLVASVNGKLLAASKVLPDESWMTLTEEPNQSKYAQNEAEHGARFFLLDGCKVDAF